VTAPHGHPEWYRQCNDAFVAAMRREHPKAELRIDGTGRIIPRPAPSKQAPQQQANLPAVATDQG
jgi:hypothetical protein